MIDRVHGNAPHLGPSTSPALSSCLPERNIFMVQVSNLAHRCFAQNVHPSDFSGGQFDLSVTAFLRHQLGRRTGAAGQLPALSPAKFDVMDNRAHGNVDNRQIIPWHNVGVGSGDDLIPRIQALRG
jgi:hypothetical protein